jgi:hypothetical protein
MGLLGIALLAKNVGEKIFTKSTCLNVQNNGCFSGFCVQM